MYKYCVMQNGKMRTGIHIANFRKEVYDAFDDVVYVEPVFARRVPTYGFYKSLELLSKQGYTIFEALSFLRNSSEHKKDKKIAANLADSLAQGETFANSLKYFTDVSSFLVSLFTIAEQSGDLVGALAECTEYLEEQERIRKKVTQELSYPILLFVFSAFFLFFLSHQVLPVFESMYRSFDVLLPVVTRATLAIGNALRTFGIEIVVGIALITLLLKIWMLYSPSLLYRMERRRFLLSPIGKLRRSYFQYLFFKKVELLNAYHNNIFHTVRDIVEAESSPFIRQNLEQVKEGMYAGEETSEALRKTPLFDGIAEIILAGVRTRDFTTKVARDLSDYYKEAFRAKLTRILSFITPVALLVLGAGILFLAVGLLVPLFRLPMSIFG